MRAERGDTAKIERQTDSSESEYAQSRLFFETRYRFAPRQSSSHMAAAVGGRRDPEQQPAEEPSFESRKSDKNGSPRRLVFHSSDKGSYIRSPNTKEYSKEWHLNRHPSHNNPDNRTDCPLV